MTHKILFKKQYYYKKCNIRYIEPLYKNNPKRKLNQKQEYLKSYYYPKTLNVFFQKSIFQFTLTRKIRSSNSRKILQ